MIATDDQTYTTNIDDTHNAANRHPSSSCQPPLPSASPLGLIKSYLHGMRRFVRGPLQLAKIHHKRCCIDHLMMYHAFTPTYC